MDDKHISTLTTEEHILRRIVNAILAAEQDLRDASPRDWTRTLIASCRLQRRAMEGEICG
jgi:hypothetical protein